jgi:hypothetical protein
MIPRLKPLSSIGGLISTAQAAPKARYTAKTNRVGDDGKRRIDET